MDTVIEDSFWRCKNESPVVQSVPETMFTFWPARDTWATAKEQHMQTARHRISTAMAKRIKSPATLNSYL